MTRSLYWKLFLIIGAGVVGLFYLIDIAISQIENDMSLIDEIHSQALTHWSQKARAFYLQRDMQGLESWLNEIQEREYTRAAVARAEVSHIAGSIKRYNDYSGYNMSRNISWQINLYFHYSPNMELPSSDGKTSLLVQLPKRMRPGSSMNVK